MSETKKGLNLRPNVIDGSELKELLTTVFDQMAYYVARTYGPYGDNTIYQEGGKLLTTKDGWNVEQGILYSKSVLATMVRKMIIDVSTSINTRAGDGTSTGLISADKINNLVIEYKETNKVHSKLLTAVIKFCVEKICEEIKRSATPVTEDNVADVIYRVALVSLDWNRELAGFIRDIYKETSNTVIGVQNSGTEKSYVEYASGYDISAKLITDFKVNNAGERRYKVKNPIILMFSYTITASMFEPLITAATAFNVGLNRELVVIAPNFEKDFRDAYQALCIRLIKDNKPLPTLVPVRYFAEYNIEREMLVDLCFLTGATNIAKEDSTGEDIIRELASTVKQDPPDSIMFVKDDGHLDKDAYNKALEGYKQGMIQAQKGFLEKIAEYIGQCDELEVTTKKLTVSGFNGLENSTALTTRINTIQSEIDKAMKDFSAKSMFTEEVKLKRIRLGKLRLKMGTIYVGGFGESQLKATRDALDDAINACANAYTNGVVLGGGITIPLTIENMRAELHDEKSELFKESMNFCNENGLSNISMVIDILAIIQKGFIATWEIMLKNKYPDGIAHDVNAANYTEGPCTMTDIVSANVAILDGNRPGVIGDKLDVHSDGHTVVNPRVRTIIGYCMNNKKPWNLITNQLDDTIIHPVRVETEVLKGCLNLILTTTTTNQLIYNGYDDVDLELEGMREVKD